MTKKKKEQIVNTPAPAVAVKKNKPKYKQSSQQNKNRKTVLNNTKELEKQAREKYINFNKQKLEEQEPNLGPIDLRLKLKEQWNSLAHEEQQKYRDMVVRIAAPEQAKAKVKPLRAFQFYDAEHENDENLKGLSQSEKKRKLAEQWQALSGKEQAKYFKQEIEAVKAEKRKQGLPRKYNFDLLQAKKSPKAFALYRQKKIERLKKKFPELSEGEIGHKLKEQWEAEKPERKQKYLDDAKELKNQLKQLQEKRKEQYSGVKRKRESSTKTPLINLSSEVPLKAPKAFSLYKFDKFEMVKKENPKSDSKEVHQKIKDEWKKETPAVKEKYLLRARNIKQQLSSDFNHLLKERRKQNDKAKARRMKNKERAKQKWKKIKEKVKERKQRKLEQTIDEIADK